MKIKGAYALQFVIANLQSFLETLVYTEWSKSQATHWVKDNQ
jgi:hypothetical protein